MFTHKDINMRTIFVVNCIEHARKLRVNDGELLLEDIDGEKPKTLTKFLSKSCWHCLLLGILR